jgi:hypothetical protein
MGSFGQNEMGKEMVEIINMRNKNRFVHEILIFLRHK